MKHTEQKDIHGFIGGCKEVYNDIHNSVEHIRETLGTPQGQFLVQVMGLSAVILFGDNEDIYEGKNCGLEYVYGPQKNVNALLGIITKQRDAGELPSVEVDPPNVRLEGGQVIIEENKDEADV